MITNNVVNLLQQAIIHNNAAMVKLLVESGSQDINAQSETGTALHILALMPDIDPLILELLLSNGADINAAGPGGDTPLHTAAFSPFTSVIVTLLKNGADINISNEFGYTALDHLSIRRDWKSLQKEIAPYIQVPSNTVSWMKKSTDKRKELEEFMKGRWDAMDYYTRAYQYANTGYYAESIKEYVRGLQHYPYKESDNISGIPASARVFFADTHNNIGATYAKMGQWRSALEEYEKVLFYLPDDPEALNNIGACHNKLGDIEESIKCRQKALVAYPDYAEAHVNLGNSYLYKKEFMAAIDEYTRAIDIWQKDERVYTIAYFNRAVCYNNLEMFEKAIADYEIVKKYDFGNEFIDAYQRQGNIYALQGDHVKAIDDFTEMTKRTKSSEEKAVAYNSRAVSFAVLGNVRQAFEDFNTAIKLYPSYDEPVYNLEGLMKKFIRRML
jgi:tetratricopeptide (TPR) repeat protein